jgi:hypothetical protein
VAAAAPTTGAGALPDGEAAVGWLGRCCAEVPEGFAPLVLLIAASVLVRLPATAPSRTRLAAWVECMLLLAHLRRRGDVAALRKRVEAHHRAALGRERAAARTATVRTVGSADALLSHAPLLARAGSLEGLAAGLGNRLVVRTPEAVVEILPPRSAKAGEDADGEEKGSGGGPPPSPHSSFRFG